MRNPFRRSGSATTADFHLTITPGERPLLWLDCCGQETLILTLPTNVATHAEVVSKVRESLSLVTEHVAWHISQTVVPV